MKLRMGILGIAALAATASSISLADRAKHEQKYCAALGDFRADLKSLESMGSESTLQELRETSDRAADDANRVVKEGGKIKTPTSKQFVESARQLRNETQSLPENLTIGQAQARIQGDVQRVKQSARQLAAESGCPQPEETPKQQG